MMLGISYMFIPCQIVTRHLTTCMSDPSPVRMFTDEAALNVSPPSNPRELDTVERSSYGHETQ